MSSVQESCLLTFEITNLQSRYAHALDDGRLDEVLAMFTADGVFQAAVGGRMEGRDAIYAYFASQRTAPEWVPYRGGQHLVTNIIVTPTATDRVTAVSDFILAVPDEAGARVLFLGRYVDDIVRQDGEWLFAERQAIQNPCARS
jgi:uncharacterized protein (TIGR02246 family)